MVKYTAHDSRYECSSHFSLNMRVDVIVTYLTHDQTKKVRILYPHFSDISLKNT